MTSSGMRRRLTFPSASPLLRMDSSYTLQHVLYWNRDHWQGITPQEASQRFGSVAAREQKFACGLCMQFVSFVAAGGKRAHFRHSQGEKDKSCRERAVQWQAAATLDQELILPLKLVLEDGRMSFRIGFFLSGGSTVEGERAPEGSFSITADDLPLNVYRFDRIWGRGFAYLPAGTRPAKRYVVRTEGDARGAEHWPRIIPGCLDQEVLFNGVTGKRLPLDADVSVGDECLLLTPFDARSCPGVSVQYVSVKNWCGGSLYRVKATEYTFEAAAFFAERRARLTSAPVRFFPLWPMTTKRPSAIEHEGGSILFISSGEGIELKAWPVGAAKCRIDPAHKPLVEVGPGTERVLVSAGRSTVLKYASLEERPLRRWSMISAADAELRIENNCGEALLEDRQRKRLPHDEVVISLSCRGVAEVLKNGVLLERFELAQAAPKTYCLPWGSELRILVGLDRVRTLCYGPQADDALGRDDSARMEVELKRLERFGHPLCAAAKLVVRQGVLPLPERVALMRRAAGKALPPAAQAKNNINRKG